MAPAIVHFLVGAALVLLVAAPLAVRYDAVRRHGVGLVAIGGIWGLFPDVHHVAPVYEGAFRTLHDSGWADLFAFHYTLDRPPVRAYAPHESSFPAVLLFLGAAAVFALAAEWGSRRDPGPIEFGRDAIVGAASGAAVTTVVLGGVLHASGRLAAVAALARRESTLAGWAVLVVVAVVAAGAFAVCIELVAGDAATPSTNAALGAAAAVPIWFVGTTLVVPLWRMRVLDAPLEVSVGDPVTLGVTTLAAGTLGWTYATVTRMLGDRGSETRRSRSEKEDPVVE